MSKKNKSHSTSWLIGILCILLFLILISGIGLLLTGSKTGSSWMNVHKFSGIIFCISLLIHIISHFKWYKAWLTGKIKKQNKVKFTIGCSVFFVLLIIGFLLKPILIPYYGIIHGIIGIVGCILMVFHFKDKRESHKVG